MVDCSVWLHIMEYFCLVPWLSNSSYYINYKEKTVLANILSGKTLVGSKHFGGFSFLGLSTVRNISSHVTKQIKYAKRDTS